MTIPFWGITSRACTSETKQQQLEAQDRTKSPRTQHIQLQHLIRKPSTQHSTNSTRIWTEKKSALLVQVSEMAAVCLLSVQ
jgi:hypothetical protein